MPLIQRDPHIVPYLLYDAPVDEKTKKLREKFKIDESGYPEQYKWRGLSRLGPVYNPADPYKLFDEYDPKTAITTHLGLFVVGAVICGATAVFVNLKARRPWWAKSWIPVLGTLAFGGAEMLIYKQALTRQALKNAITVDYIEKHPDRFPPIKRPKLREVLHVYYPMR